ncbi:hypothetical protein BKA70DRAFT_90303 [Coprinopsis sp. MPI-PUGE-AT-0042]|nr:hypothetical protein BKA70DRAFT_90303 [Coprinopsis sp. MPI-PUGE-AT-0042]
MFDQGSHGIPSWLVIIYIFASFFISRWSSGALGSSNGFRKHEVPAKRKTCGRCRTLAPHRASKTIISDRQSINMHKYIWWHRIYPFSLRSSNARFTRTPPSLRNLDSDSQQLSSLNYIWPLLVPVTSAPIIWREPRRGTLRLSGIT